ncbi:MAG: bifunctional diaminohydroxyphosphoribosylaminopyrimidine deaminase/5-amino-6-(5-phosphoribosylamino)uracil reductase RibD [Cyclobacteriaceae bacterium]
MVKKETLNREKDQNFMLRAMELAELGRGFTSPNPMVGCVIVHENKIIGEGYHKKYGGPHAEPNAIQEVENKDLLAASTLYVTLEPCSHFGKTPPCADLIVQHHLKRVVIGAKDANPLVGGKGIRKLQEAGITVETGLLEKEIRLQNRRFFTFMEKTRPYIILKWAQTKDGWIARSNFDSKWISNPLSRQFVHRWRAEEDAIMVGTTTAKVDNPKLNVRDWSGKDPVRVFIDNQRTLDPNLNLFDGSQPTICFNKVKTESGKNLEWVKLEKAESIEKMVAELYHRNIQSLIVEGGTQLLTSFLEAGLWDEARVFTGNVFFGQGIPAPIIPVPAAKQIDILDDVLNYYIRR